MVGAAAAAASGAAPGLPGAGPVSVGVIGTGVRGRQLLHYLAESARFRVAAVCDVLPFRLEEARSLYPEAAAHDDHRRLLDDSRIDAVVIATTFSEHHPVVLDALAAGKHVYCEKSMIKGIEETLEVVAAARRRRTQVFQTGFQYHSSPLYDAAVGLARRGELGELVSIDCQWNRNGDWRRRVPDPRWERQVNWRLYREYSGGLVAELSAHQMDFCNRLAGSEPATIQGSGGIDFWRDGRETYDNVHVLCRYESGLTASFTSLTANSLDGYRVAVLGSRGSLILTTRRGWFVPESEPERPPEGLDLVTGASVRAASASGYKAADGRAAFRLNAPADDPTPRALEDFASAIAGERAPASSVYTGATVAIMVQLALDAMDTGRLQHWRPDYVLRA